MAVKKKAVAKRAKKKRAPRAETKEVWNVGTTNGTPWNVRAKDIASACRKAQKLSDQEHRRQIKTGELLYDAPRPLAVKAELVASLDD
jgi:hypothetical protein